MNRRSAAFLAAIPLICLIAHAQSRPISLPWQVTHADQASPSISPDGKKMVYSVVVAGREQLFTINLDGTGQLQLTSDSADHDNPIWSPDGRSIVYELDANGGESIFKMNADGSGVERVTPDDRQKYIHPNWSPDGSKIIYCSTDDLHPPLKNTSNIYSIDLKTRSVATLVTGGTNTYASWSPDGKKIAFRKIVGGEMNSEVFVVNSDGAAPRNLTNSPAFDGWPAWSPDGSRIAFGSNRDGNYRIFVMDSDGGHVRPLAATEGRATEPRWSPDGKTIYFTNCQSVAWGRDCEIFAASADASPVE